MDKAAIAKTEAIGPIVRMLEQAKPDYKSIALRMLNYLGLEELGYILGNRRQDWEAVTKALQSRLEDDGHWVRVRSVLECLSTPQDLDQIAKRTGLHRMSVSQTINALCRGGYSISFQHEGDKEGRPRKVFFL